MTIHKEGKSILLLLLIFLILINYILNLLTISEPILYFSYLTSTVFYLLILQFFRSPNIKINQNSTYVLAPADGKVVVIEETEESEFLKDQRIQISIFMSPLDVHVNRNPVGGIVKYFKYHAGKYLVAWHPKSSSENERTTIVYELANGVHILTRQIAGAVARRIKCYIAEQEQVNQGEEFGFIKFGSRVDVFLPLDADVKVKIDQKAQGGRTVLAELKL